MFKIKIIITSFLFCQISIGQVLKMDYFPPYSNTVGSESYDKGKEILKNAYRQIKESKNGIVGVDYWNVAVAYAYMGVSADSIFALLQQHKNVDSASLCEYAQYFIDQENGVENIHFYKILGDAFTNLISDCVVIAFEPPSIEKMMAEKKKHNLKGLNEALIDQLIILMEKDQRYRYKSSVYNKNTEKQHQLDEEVAMEISKIIDKYRYPGRDLVGERYKNWACLFVEHAGGKSIPKNLIFKEKYFSIILDAYHKGQFDKPYLTMLIDRIHMFKYKKQVFGSQSGIPFHDEATINKLLAEYGL